MNTDLRLSKHFLENWAVRVGGTPTPEQVADIITRGVRVQTGQLMRDSRGHDTNTLSIYWDPERDVIVKIDWFRRTAVSVLSAANCRAAGGR